MAVLDESDQWGFRAREGASIGRPATMKERRRLQSGAQVDDHLCRGALRRSIWIT